MSIKGKTDFSRSRQAVRRSSAPNVVPRTVLITAFVLATGISVYFATFADAPLPDQPWMYGQKDIALHVLAFCAITVLASCAFHRSWKIWLPIACLALVLELLQWPLPGRDASGIDLLSSFLGIFCGYLLVSAGSHLIHHGTE